MHALLHPQSIAIVGASNDPRKLSGRPIDYMKRFGYQGRILPINPNRSQVQGIRAYASLDEIDGQIDLAMILLPAEQVCEAVRACAKRGIGAAVIGASGFAEVGESGAELQEQLAEVAADGGIRVLGPNCLGLINVGSRAMPTFTSALDENIELHDGPVAFVSQSGAFGSFIFSEAQRGGIGISHYVNTGNEVDLSVAEVLDGLLESSQTQVLLAYLEGVSDGQRLIETARKAHELDKPIVLTKVGTSDAGARAAQSHTASLAGQDEVFDSVVRQQGVIRVGGTEAMLDAAQVFRTGRRVTGRGMTVVTASGGAGVLMSDAAVAEGLEVTAWDSAWQTRMAEVIPSYGSPRNPIDLTGTLATDPGLLSRSLEVATTHPETHMISVLLGNSEASADDLVDAVYGAQMRTDIPIVVVWTGGSGRPRQRLQELGIPCFSDAGRAAAALARLADFSLRPQLPSSQRPDGLDRAAADEVISEARAVGRKQLDENEAARLVSAYGVPTVASRAARDPDDAARAAEELDGPFVVKLLSAEVGHKSDIGGVRVGLADRAAVGEAAEQVLRSAQEHHVRDARLLVQHMVSDGTELIVGIKHDDVFGPVVVVGLGGVFVDVLADSQSAVAPIDPDTGRRLLTDLRGSRVLEGVRGGTARDVDAVAEIISRLSWLAVDFEDTVAELDINPLLVAESGCGAVAADALVVLTDYDETVR